MTTEPLLRHFDYGHLPDGPMRAMSALFNAQAYLICDRVPPSAERTVALRKLLESKDAAVRCVVDELRGVDPAIGAKRAGLDSPQLADPGHPDPEVRRRLEEDTVAHEAQAPRGIVAGGGGGGVSIRREFPPDARPTAGV